ncbi:TPR domain protein [Roseibacterium elongatum DSM 19469]|uniref:TPR domain protein n=2 Tax=Roseicyclus elongatus TaxID=159346 RepID=W8RRW4_9RHOB|nr:TPR domain protein [Roseibacterium elongatum DSM 19469]
MGAAQSGLAGPYLAARAAVIGGDHREAAAYFESALLADPGNPLLIGNAVFANAALGNFGRAAAIAEDMPDSTGGQELINLVRLVELIRLQEWDRVRAEIGQGRGAGPFIDDLALGWLSLGAGDMSRAVRIFETIAEDRLMAELGALHLALAHAATGNFERADALLSSDAMVRISQTERVVRGRAEILVQLGRRADALDLLDGYTQQVPDPALLELQARIGAGAEGPYGFVATAAEGVAEVFFTVAQALGGDAPSNLPLIYARAAAEIAPDHADARMLAAELLYDSGQFALAADAYGAVPADSDQYVEAQMGRAEAIEEMGDIERATDVLAQLAQERPDLASVLAGYADMLRRAENCQGAIDAYTAALDLVDTDQPRYWFVHYARGICHHRTDDWDAAEADFRRALELNPEQPQVLNYLGYSLVEQRRNLDEALGMIERAVAARPDSGYIVDSLGWVFYRLGRFDEAVEPMERAVQLLPTDPIVNDHLGDVYWMVGREREARFQWERALSFDPEDEDATRIRRKLEIGLDRVLEEEGGVGETQ